MRGNRPTGEIIPQNYFILEADNDVICADAEVPPSRSFFISINMKIRDLGIPCFVPECRASLPSEISFHFAAAEGEKRSPSVGALKPSDKRIRRPRV